MTPAQFKAIRNRYGLSQSDLASLLRLSDGRTIRRYEDGSREISGPVSIILELMDADELPNRFWPQYGEGE